MKGDLENRFDPLFYSENIFNFLKTTPFEVKKIREIQTFTKSGFGAGKGDQNLEGNGYIQIRPTNLDESGFLKFDKNVFIPQSYLDENNVNLLQDEDVLFNNTNSQELVGKTAYFDLDGTYLHSNHITVIRVDKTVILPKFLWILLNIYQERKIFFNICTNWNNQSGVGIDRLLSLKIPLPPNETQQTIINIFENAYNEKKAKEAEAKALLDSIDSYLLEELGITLPEKQDKLLKNRVFLRNINEVSGGRFDPNKYQPDTLALAETIEKSNHPKVKLKELVTQSFAGDWGIDDNDEFDENLYIRCLVIRATEFDNIYNLKIDNSRVKFRLINKVKFEKLDIKADDLLIEKSGGSEDQPVGRIAIIEQKFIDQTPIAYSNFIHKIRIDESKIYPSFLFYFLKTIHNIKITEAMQSQTNGIRNLIMNEYLNQLIIVPNVDIQIEIANKISQTKEQAKRLQTEAKAVLEKAKIEVERMILGE